MNYDEQAKREFEDAYPERYRDDIEEIKIKHNSLMVTLKEGYTICPKVTQPMLDAGWVVSSHNSGDDQNDFWWNHIKFEEREVRRTITETKTVATMEGR